jgi:hypothetical protein
LDITLRAKIQYIHNKDAYIAIGLGKDSPEAKVEKKIEDAIGDSIIAK